MFFLPWNQIGVALVCVDTINVCFLNILLCGKVCVGSQNLVLLVLQLLFGSYIRTDSIHMLRNSLSDSSLQTLVFLSFPAILNWCLFPSFCFNWIEFNWASFLYSFCTLQFFIAKLKVLLTCNSIITPVLAAVAVKGWDFNSQDFYSHAKSCWLYTNHQIDFKILQYYTGRLWYGFLFSFHTHNGWFLTLDIGYNSIISLALHLFI